MKAGEERRILSPQTPLSNAATLSRRHPLSKAASMRVARRKLDAAKRVNRTHSKYSFELTDLCLAGLPEQVSSEALMVQCVRGPKLTATEEAEINEEKLSQGQILWAGQKLSFVATLYASKTGKDFSAKKYKVRIRTRL